MQSLTATTSWQSVTLDSKQIWQVSAGSVWLDTESVEADRNGIHLITGQSLEFESGTVLYYKSSKRFDSKINRISL